MQSGYLAYCSGQKTELYIKCQRQSGVMIPLCNHYKTAKNFVPVLVHLHKKHVPKEKAADVNVY
jgi:hypothetical protein